MRGIQVLPVQQPQQGVAEGLQTVQRYLGGSAEAGQVHREHPVVGRQRVEIRPPSEVGLGEAVHQEHGRAGAHGDGVHRHAVVSDRDIDKVRHRLPPFLYRFGRRMRRPAQAFWSTSETTVRSSPPMLTVSPVFSSRWIW